MYKINANFLDKNKQYGVFCVSRSKSPTIWAIRAKAKQSIKILGYDKSVFDKYGIATHSAICIYENFEWWIYESHYETGVQKVKLKEWHDTKGSNCYFHEDEFNVDVMHALTGREYGKVDMIGFFNEYLIRFLNTSYSSKFHNFDNGFFCTEYYSFCCKKGAFENILGFKAYHNQEPCMHQHWAIKNKNVFKIEVI